MRSRPSDGDEPVAFNLPDVDEDLKEPQGVKIELKNIVFKYPTRDVPVLKGLNMTVRHQSNS
jgi:hypothetical protein